MLGGSMEVSLLDTSIDHRNKCFNEIIYILKESSNAYSKHFATKA